MPDITILIVEDDPKIRTLLRNVMEGEGFCVAEASSAAEALRLVERRALSLITLDIHLGADSGLELARRIRAASQVPIIMVTARDDVIDRVVGLEIGADDYITKPFHIREVIARVRSVLRRAGGRAPPGPAAAGAADETDAGAEAGAGASVTYRFDGMVAVPDRLELRDRAGGDRLLTAGDFRLLTAFLERPGRVLSRDRLMDLTGGRAWSPLDRTIDNQVARLRKKIERDPSDPRLIKTVRGMGYTLACDVQALHAPASPARSA